jgi:hypothetical protein
MRVATEIDERLIVKDDAWLNLHAEEFRRLMILELTGVTFGQYLEDPECYSMYALALADGGKLQQAQCGRGAWWGPVRVTKGENRGH